MKNQKTQVLEYIERFGSITSLQAFQDLMITRLGSRIHELRKDGYNIISENISVKNRFGKPVTYSKYRLEK